MKDHLPIAEKFKALGPILNEQGRRLWAATEAMVLGRGGVSLVAQATGLSRPTIYAGIQELRGEPAAIPGRGQGRSRRAGGGRKRRVEHDPTLLADLEALVEPTTRGDPQSPLRWTCKSVRRLAEELRAQGHQVSPQVVGDLLHEADYSLQGTRKTREGGKHPDRNAQFEHIAARVRDFQKRHQPVISVDAKKKELVGDFKNAGREWHPKGQPPQVRVYDFIDPQLGKAIPYGVYDVRANLGWVSVGVDHDTPAFAVATIRAWWLQMGSPMYPKAQELLITADSGGSNSTRARLWKLELQRFADESGLRVWRQPPAAGHEQVEQDRAPHVLPHHRQLAWQAAGEPRGGRQPHRRHQHLGGPADPGGSGRWPVSEGHQGQRCRDGEASDRQSPVPWRVELHDPSSSVT